MKTLVRLCLCCGLALGAIAGPDKLEAPDHHSAVSQRTLTKSHELVRPLSIGNARLAVPEREPVQTPMRYRQENACHKKVPCSYPLLELRDLRQGGETIADAVSISLPFSGTGTTLGYADDYDEACQWPATAPDVVYALTVTVTDVYNFDLFGSDYDTKLFVYAADAQSLVACNDDYWSDYTSAVQNLPLVAGVYYVVVDGYGTSSGNYQLEIARSEACDQFVVTEVQLPYTGSASTLGAPNICGTEAGEVGFRFTLLESSRISVSTCLPGTSYDTDSYLFSGNPCDGGRELLFNDGDYGCTYHAWASAWSTECGAVPAGSYVLVISGYGDSEGDFELSISAEACDCEPVPCEGTQEIEPNNGPDAEPAAFGSIACAETVCGSVFTALGDSGEVTLRDTDYFEIQLTADAEVQLQLEVENFDGTLALLDESLNLLASADNAVYCEGELLPMDCLPAGVYYARVGSTAGSVIQGSANYALSLACTDCEWIDPCDTAPVLVCNGAATVGTTIGAPDNVGYDCGERIYTFELARSSLVDIDLCSALTTYDSYLRVYDRCPLDSDAVQLAFNDDGTEADCADSLHGAPYPPSHIADLFLEAGSYWIVVEGYEAEGNFELTLSATEHICTPVSCGGTPEVEPNDGPNVDPPVFGSLLCGETLCGSTYTDVDSTGAGIRDTDFYVIELSAPSILTLSLAVENFDGELLLLDDEYRVLACADDHGYCEDEVLISDCLPQGVYYAFVAHNTYWGVSRPAGYALSLHSESCVYQSPYTCWQAPVSPEEDWSFALINAGAGNRVAERFGEGGRITALEVQVLSLYHDGIAWSSCEAGDVQVELSFYELAGELPGDLVSTQTLVGSLSENGQLFASGDSLFAASTLHLALSEPVILEEGWFSLQEQGADCWLLWGNSICGADGRCLINQGTGWLVEENDRDFALTVDRPCDRIEDLALTIAGSTLLLSWSQVAGASDYLVYASNTGYGDFVEIGRSGGRTSFTDPLALERGCRVYRVTALCP